ncbi:PRC-barrel domain-containing protein [Streptomyces sp. NPDC048389]|uniref:PRC-barrel domain-containing protein n=1 Tax=Streptomyces sp. NPDC048389 TaxID=3154622 RepID=UPI0034566166
MSTLMLASEIGRRPVVTLSGEAVAQVKDIVFEGRAGRVSGFTLSGRGIFSGPKRQALPWAAVTALGPHAVMVRDEAAFEARSEVVDRGEAAGGDVLGSQVLTDAGTDLGKVTDVVIEVSVTAATVVGYQVASTEALGRQERTVYIPLPETVAVSGEALVIPASATDFVADDLPGFTGMVPAFRARLKDA